MKVASPAIASLLESAALTFKAALGLCERAARLEAQLLLGHVLKKSRAYLSNGSAEIQPAQFSRFDELVTRRAQGEPIAYILGYREFYSRNFMVSPAVLIPRPETELLVDLALGKLTGSGFIQVLDLGTGSGAIALSIAAHRPRIQVTAVDNSDDALAVANKNQDVLKIKNVRTQHSDWFSALHGQRFNLIVANPPYVAENDPHLEAGDVRYEPKTALRGGHDGLACISKISREANSFLKPGGWLLIEHGYDQATAVRQFFMEQGLENVASHPDLAGILRVTLGQASNPLSGDTYPP